jgi:L-lactate dehydrogenase complex protein LldG
MYDTFKARAEAAKAEVFRFPSRCEALAFLTDFLRREGVADTPHATALVADGPWLREQDRHRLAAIPGVSFAVTREHAADARFGVSRMGWALADTGTLAQDATAIALRLVSTLPSVHIALVPTSGLLPDLQALLAHVDPRTAGYLALITGPSRTADIERVLTIGVHGPERLVILFIDDLEAA